MSLQFFLWAFYFRVALAEPLYASAWKIDVVTRGKSLRYRINREKFYAKYKKTSVSFIYGIEAYFLCENTSIETFRFPIKNWIDRTS